MPSLWREVRERGSAGGSPAVAVAKYFEVPGGRFALLASEEAAIVSAGGMRGAELLMRNMLDSFGMELLGVSDSTISGRPARILDGRSAAKKELTSVAVLQDEQGITRFVFHDHASSDVEQSLRARDAVFSGLAKDERASGSGSATSTPQTAVPDDGVSEAEVQKLVIALIASKIGEAPGIGPSIVSTVLEAGESYYGLHQLLESGVPALKKLRGIGQKKAEAIADAYEELGGRELMELAARKAIVDRKKKEKLQKTVRAVLIWTAIFLGLLVMCTGPRR